MTNQPLFRRRFSLRTEIAVMFVALGLLPMVLVGWRYFSVVETQLRNEITRNLAGIADAKAGRIETFSTDRLREVRLLADTPVVADTIAALLAAKAKGPQTTERVGARTRPVLQKLLAALQARNLFLIAPDGEVLDAIGDRTEVGRNLLQEGATVAPLANVFDRARTLLEPQNSDFTFYLPGGDIALFTAAPVLRQGQVRGVVALQVDKTEVFRITGDYNGLGQTGETLLAGGGPKGVTLYGPLRGDQAADVGRRVLAEGSVAALPLQRALAGERGVGIVTDYRGQSVVAAWRYLPSFRWALMVKADVDERFVAIQRLWLVGVFVLGLVTILVVGVSMLMARAITTPISNLESAAQRFAEGEAVETIPESGAWEVLSLAEAFNEMVRRLNSYQFGLRRMVDERTAELRIARDQAESATRAKTEFLAMISHEIRTPLNGLLGMAELLRSRVKDPVSNNYVRTIEQSGRALAELLNDVLDISRIEAGKLTFDQVAFDPAATAAGLIDLMRRTAEQKGLTLTLEADPRCPARVTGDPARLRQVLLNLIGNAIKFTGRGGVVLRIDLLEQAKRRVKLQFSVIDTGIGLPEVGRERLFEAFSQLDPKRTARYGGAGLGLAICRRLVEGMGGEIAVESRDGEGTTFRVTFDLPIAEPEDAPITALEAPPVASGLRVLVVEDDPINQQVLDGLLSRDGHRVTLAATAEQALAAFEPGLFDLVMTDLRLPELGGIELAERLRRLALVPVIAVTANVMADDRDRCRAAGMAAIVAKPILLEELRDALRVAMQGAEGIGDAPVPADAAEAPLFDPAYLEDLASALPAAEVGRLLERAEGSIAESLERLKGCLADGDAAGLAEAAHRLAGAAGSYGLARLRQGAKGLEDLVGRDGAKGITETVPAKLDGLIAEVEVGLKALRRWQAENLGLD